MVYATKQDLLDRDKSMLYNLATDVDTNALDDVAIEQALEQADNEIDSLIARRFILPLLTIPGLLNKRAMTIAFYWLADSDNQATELLEKRYADAIKWLKSLAKGEIELGLPTPNKAEEGSVGKVELIQENARQMTRKSLGSVL